MSTFTLETITRLYTIFEFETHYLFFVPYVLFLFCLLLSFLYVSNSKYVFLEDRSVFCNVILLLPEIGYNYFFLPSKFIFDYYAIYFSYILFMFCKDLTSKDTLDLIACGCLYLLVCLLIIMSNRMPNKVSFIIDNLSQQNWLYMLDPTIKLIYCSRTRKFDPLKRKNFHVHDGNYAVNVLTLHNYWSDDKALVSFHGYTCCDDQYYPFPVYCDKQTFLLYVQVFKSTYTGKIRDVLHRGIFDYEARLILSPLFNSQFTRRHEHLISGSTLLLNIYLYSSTMYYVQFLPLLFLNSLMHFDTLLCVSVEEMFSQVYGPWVIIFVETTIRLANGRINLLPIVLHLILMYLPLPIRCILHYVYNKSTNYMSFNPIKGNIDLTDLDPNTIANVEMCGKIFDVIRKILLKDILGLVTSMLSNFGYIYDTLFKVTSSTPEEVLREFVSYMQPDSLAYCDDSPRNKFTWLFEWVPKSVSSSPTFSKLISFAVLMFTYNIVPNMDIIYNFRDYITWDSFLIGGDIITTSLGAIKATYEGMQRAIQQRDFKAFFHLPEAISFKRDYYRLVVAPHSDTKTLEDITSEIAEARCLIACREYKKNTVEMEKMIKDLHQFIVDKTTLLETADVRTPPFWVMLRGEPGVGKTQLVESMINRVAKIDGIPRYRQDVINVNVNLKHPAEGNINTKAGYFVYNDIRDDYTDTLRNDKQCFAVSMQQVIDTNPLSLPSATLAGKKNEYKPRVVFVNCNSQTIHCATATEKLERRADSGFFAEPIIVDESGTTLPHKKFKSMPNYKRNSSTRFRMITPAFKDNYIFMPVNGLILNQVDGLSEFERRYEAHKAYHAEKRRMFDQDLCKCGLPEVYHVYCKDKNSRAKSELEGFDPETQRCYLDDERSYHYLHPECEPLSDYSYFNVYCRPNPLTASINVIYSVYILFASLLEISCALAILLTCLFILFAAVNPRFRNFLRRNFDDYLNKKANIVREETLRWTLMNPYTYKAINLVFADDHEFLDLARAKKTMFVVKEKLEKYKYMLGGSLVAIVSYYAMTYKELNLSANIDEVKKLDPKSFTIFPPSVELSFPNHEIRGWGAGKTFKASEMMTGGVSPTDLAKKIMNNSIEGIFTVMGKGTFFGRIFVINSQIMSINKHFIYPQLAPTFEIQIEGYDYHFNYKEITITEETETIILQHALHRNFDSLLKFIPDTIRCSVDVVIPWQSNTPKSVVNYRPPQMVNNYYIWPSFVGPIDVKKGDCSYPVIGVINGTSFILGTVSYIEDSMFGRSLGGIAPLNRDIIEKSTPNITTLIGNIVLTCLPFNISDLKPLAENAAVRNVDSNFLIGLKTTTEATRTFKSQFRKTRIHDKVIPFLNKEYSIPKNTKIVQDGQYADAMTHTFKYINQPSNITFYEANSCVDKMLHDWLDDDLLTKINVSPLDMEKTIYGDSRSGLRSMDLDTSIGAFLRPLVGGSKKRDALDINIDGEIFIKEDVIKAIEERMSIIDNGDVPILFADMTVKDQVYEKKKADEANVRLFAVTGFADQVIARSLLLPLVTILMSMPEKNGCMGTLNCGSLQFHEMMEHVRTHPNFFDMDFSKFDVAHLVLIFMAIARFFELFALKCKYDVKQAKRVFIVVFSLCYSLVRYQQDIIFKSRGLLSGHVLTLIINSLINYMLLYISFQRLVDPKAFELDNTSFTTHVVTKNMGDDNINSVSNEVKDKFNTLTIIEEVKKMGYIATPASKEDVPQKFLEFENLVFLKRKARWDATLGWTAPIDTDSLFRCLAFERGDNGVSPVERLQGTIIGTQHEAFLHGEEYFNTFQSNLKDIMLDTFISYELLEYSDLMEKYLNKNFFSWLS